MADLTLGSIFAGCRLEAVAGRGGMGVVYRARQLVLDRPVALKAIAPQLAANAAYRERFDREAHLAASIDHPNVIPVYEAGELDATLYLIMRWVEGTDLRALVKSRGRLSPARAVQLLRPIAAALAAAHRHGLIHRDVKPANVLIATGDTEEDDHPYLTDFGIARRGEEGGTMTRTGVLVGTLDYTAPERIEGAKATPASDIYSFGCMLFEVVTGHLPYDRPSEMLKMHAHLNDPLPSARTEVPEVPARLDEVIAKAMAKDPAQRFGSAGELAATLGAALEDQRVAATADTVNRPTELATVLEDRPPPAIDPTAAETPAAPTPISPALSPSPAVSPASPPASPPPPPRPRSRTPLLAGLAALLAVAIAAILIGVISSGSSSSSGGSPGTSSTAASSASPVAAPQVRSGSVTVGPAVELGAGSSPTGLALAGSDVWVADRAHGRLALVSGGSVKRTISVPGQPDKVAVDGQGRVLVTQPALGQVLVDAGGSNPRPVKAGSFPGPIAISSSAAWVANTGDNTVTRIDLGTLAASQISLPSPPEAIAEAYGRVWVASSGGQITVLDDDGSPDRVLPPTGVPSGVVAISSSNGVWFLSAGSGGAVLTRVDPRQDPGIATPAGGGRLRYAVHPRQAVVGRDPRDVEAFTGSNIDDTIWVTSGGDSALRRIRTNDPGNNTTVAQVGFGAAPEALAVAPHAVWVAVPSAGLVYSISY